MSRRELTMNSVFRWLTRALAALSIAVLAGCLVTPPASTQMRPELAAQGITLVRALPAQLPDKAVAVPHAQFVLVPNENAAGLLVPVPFVAEAITGVFDRNVAEGLEQRYASIAPYRLALAAMQGSPLFRPAGGALTLKPFVFITECVDDRYRIASVFQLEGSGWIGRYTVHLPTTYPLDAFKQPSAATLATLQTELTEAAAQLRGLVERGARGELGPSAVRAEVGSLHLVGGRSGGLLSPTMVRARNAEVLEETADRVIVRLPGFMGMAGTSGGLFFGVHVLRKDQLHTFNKG
jgi:hypothetical protein